MTLSTVLTSPASMQQSYTDCVLVLLLKKQDIVALPTF